MSNVNPVLLRWTRFASKPDGTGPEKRSAQIMELVHSAGFAVRDMVPPASAPRLTCMVAGLKARLTHGSLASVDRAGVGLLGYRSHFYSQALTAHTGPKVLLWETTYDDVLPALAHAAGFRVIALPHNLESLVSDAVFRGGGYDPAPDLAAEIRRLRLADKIFTIAREERWLLEAGGLEPGYLPFFPIGELATECVGRREHREQSAAPNGVVSGPLLLLGSAFNPATARGMQLQLEWLASDQTSPREIIVAGGDTDRHFAAFASPRIRILGSVSREKLLELYAKCSALLIHTRGGAGAVTRIPEALAAGVPVIVNSNGARDQHGTAGVHVYEGAAEFLQLARTGLPLPPSPAWPVSQVGTFHDTLRKFAAASSS